MEKCKDILLPWLEEQIKIIFKHPENFCFVFGLAVIFASPLAVWAFVEIEDFLKGGMGNEE